MYNIYIYIYIYGRADFFTILKTGVIMLISHKRILGYLTADSPQSYEGTLAHVV